jgi:hypothetical protein
MLRRYMKVLRKASLPLLACRAGAWAQEFARALEDNSFLIEEAFNQEEQVVQHISTLVSSTALPACR